jgi:predicted NUDIX family NTP pyrophosphohydrolase
VIVKLSAGLLMFRRLNDEIQVFLVHPGGPFWKKKEEGAWSIPKGEYVESEEPLDAAKREFLDETGFKPGGEFIELGAIKQPSGKRITVWAFEGDCSPDEMRSHTFTMEWPPKSGQQQEFPEVDRANWFTLGDARKRILKGQIEFLDRLVARLQ